MKQHTFSVYFEVFAPSHPAPIKLEARAELHHSEPHYILTEINILKEEDGVPVKIPFARHMKIKRTRSRDGATRWVHCETEEESLLATLAGEAIDKAETGG